jgi:hypothetical protein
MIRAVLFSGVIVSGCGVDIPAVDHDVGTLVRGELTMDDFELNDGSVADAYRVRLERDEEITIVVRAIGPAPRLDPYTFVFDEETQDEITHDDDGGGGFNSLILLTAPKTGSFGIVVTTYETGFHGGTYELETFPGLDPNAR